MKKMLFAALAALTVAGATSCAKTETPEPAAAEAGNVTVSFVAEPNTTRAFFDPSATTEA